MTPEIRNYYPNLDIIRFLAALWVVFAHYGHIGPYLSLTGYGPSDGIIAVFLQYGYLGVPIFFILSGFVIAHVSTVINPSKFMTNRILRIMPAFWSCMTISFLLIAALNVSQALNVNLWFSNLFLLPQVFGQSFIDGVYWTLVFEFVFYGWVFVLLLSGAFHKHLLKICAIWLAASFANNLFLENKVIELLFITYYTGAFVSGIVMWHAKQNKWTPSHVLLLTLSCGSLSIGIEHLGIQAQLQDFNNQPNLLTSSICAIFSIAVVATAIYGKNLPIGRSFAATLGAISYPLYLIHQEVGYLVLQVFTNLGLSPLNASIRVIAMAIIISYIIHVMLEKPIRIALKTMLDKALTIASSRVQFIPAN